jgi:site-specific recombinase XerD
MRATAGLEGVRLHDLRHTFASVAAAGGATLPLIGNLLGHSQPATTARYAHLSADPVRQVSEDTGRRISQAMSPVTSAEIIPITRSQS